MSVDARGSQLIRLNGDSSLGDYLAVSSGSVMDQTSCSVLPCVAANVFAIATYPPARYTRMAADIRRSTDLA